MHPKLPVDMAAAMVSRAALALARNNHPQSVGLKVDMETTNHTVELTWPTTDFATLPLHDEKRITEDGAEAVALAVVHHEKKWTVARRLQQGEHADWLLRESAPGSKKHIALETSGVDKGKITARLSMKMNQIAEADADFLCVGVVGFERPEIAIRLVESSK